MILPRKFGPYLLVELIARGGMAEVYRATIPGATGFEKTVAIKMVLPHLAEDKDFVDMLIDEARIIVNINHSNIAQVLDLGEIDGVYYIAMEFINGLDLDALLKASPDERVPQDHAAFISSNILAGLHHAHQSTDATGRPLGVVHRDVSPHNVLISLGGDIKIIDFGVAKIQSDGRSDTRAGVIKGKLLYMSPEQAMAKEVDGRADIFAVGVNLYRMVTGVLPFDGETEYQIYNNILTRPVRPPKELVAELSEELNQIIMMLLQRDIQKRYQDGYSAKMDLERALQNISPGYSASRFSRYVENNFSHMMRRQVHQSGINDFAPNTPASNVLRTGEHVSLDSQFSNQKIPVYTNQVPNQRGPEEETPMSTPQFNPVPAPAPLAPQVAPVAPKAPSRIMKLLPPLGLAFVFWMVSGGLIFYKSQNDAALPVKSDVKAEAAVPTQGDESPEVDDSEKGKVVVAKVDGEEEKESPKEEVKNVNIHIVTTPSGAIATTLDVEVGITPMTLLVEKSEEEMEVILEKEGFEPMTVKIIPNQPFDESFELLPLGGKKKIVAVKKIPKKVAAKSKKTSDSGWGTKKKKIKNTTKIKKKKKPSSVGILLDDDEPKKVVKKKALPKQKEKKKKDNDSIDIFDL